MIVGLDMGGTHIDGVIIENGTIINTVKKPRADGDIFGSIWGALEGLLLDQDTTKIERINLSTTVSTNAIVEDKTTPVGMVIQTGPGLSGDFLACGSENVFISGCIDHRGKVVERLDSKEIDRAKELFIREGLSACAVVTKFSTRNFEHEVQIKRLLGDGFDHITMGHTLSGMLNFPRRVFSAYLNAAIHNTFNRFSHSIKKAMIEREINAPLFILKADGGTTVLAEAENRPIETILSGPAASFMGLNALLKTQEDALLLDIGGTTTDIFFLADGVPLFEPMGIEINSYKTLTRAIYSVSMGLGGDSSVRVENREIMIGPRREGLPYALGGPCPTPTDAMIALGLVEFGDRKKATAAMKSLGQILGLSVEETARDILDIMADMIKSKVDELLDKINDKPVYTVHELLHGRKLRPRLINLIGGPSKYLSPVIEKAFGLPCHYPKDYAIANAIGAAMAKMTQDITLVADTERRLLTVGEFGVRERIGRGFTLKDARKRAIGLLEDRAVAQGANKGEIETEIIEENSFNMVDGFYTVGKNIRVKAQIKPGLAGDLKL
ncbi:MAG TPA: hydantoinase/oxoprolinase family protein [Clostridia bacterium]|nr:hydantoinase/oxoprolinase family protein [Clostridia bacterium]